MDCSRQADASMRCAGSFSSCMNTYHRCLHRSVCKTIWQYLDGLKACTHHAQQTSNLQQSGEAVKAHGRTLTAAATDFAFYRTHHFQRLCEGYFRLLLRLSLRHSTSLHITVHNSSRLSPGLPPTCCCTGHRYHEIHSSNPTMMAPVFCAESNPLCLWTNAAAGHVPPNAASRRAV